MRGPASCFVMAILAVGFLPVETRAAADEDGAGVSVGASNCEPATPIAHVLGYEIVWFSDHFNSILCEGGVTWIVTEGEAQALLAQGWISQAAFGGRQPYGCSLGGDPNGDVDPVDHAQSCVGAPIRDLYWSIEAESISSAQNPSSSGDCVVVQEYISFKNYGVNTDMDGDGGGEADVRAVWVPYDCAGRKYQRGEACGSNADFGACSANPHPFAYQPSSSLQLEVALFDTDDGSGDDKIDISNLYGPYDEDLTFSGAGWNTAGSPPCNRPVPRNTWCALVGDGAKRGSLDVKIAKTVSG